MRLYDRFRAALELSAYAAVLLMAASSAYVLVWPRLAGGYPSRNQRPAIEAVDGDVRTTIGSHVMMAGGTRMAIIEFSDFECPFCARYARETYPAVRRELIDKGIAAYSFRHLPLERIHKNASRASIAAECAAKQRHFWTMHDALFSNQSHLEQDSIDRYAMDINLDMVFFRACISSEHPKRAIRNDVEEAERLGIKATPAFLLGVLSSDGTVKVTHRINGAQPYRVFVDAVALISKLI